MKTFNESESAPISALLKYEINRTYSRDKGTYAGKSTPVRGAVLAAGTNPGEYVDFAVGGDPAGVLVNDYVDGPIYVFARGCVLAKSALRDAATGDVFADPDIDAVAVALTAIDVVVRDDY